MLVTVFKNSCWKVTFPSQIFVKFFLPYILPCSVQQRADNHQQAGAAEKQLHLLWEPRGEAQTAETGEKIR